MTIIINVHLSNSLLYSLVAEKIISLQRGVSVMGGKKIYGIFKDLKSCMTACTERPICFGGDYNRWSRQCFIHQSGTACGTIMSAPHVIHFSKIPCSKFSLKNLKYISGNTPNISV